MSCSTLYFMHNLSLQPRSNVLYSTLPQHSALSNAWEALGLLNFFCRDASACVQPSARNPCSSLKASTIFRILSSNNYFVPVSSWMHVSALWGSYMVWSSFSFLSLDELLQSHFNVTCIRLYPKLIMWVSFFMFFDCLDLKTNKYIFFAWIRGTCYEPLWRLLKCLFLWPIFLYTLRIKGRKCHLVRGQFTLHFSHFPNIAGWLNKLSNTLLHYFHKANFEYCNIYRMMWFSCH